MNRIFSAVLRHNSFLTTCANVQQLAFTTPVRFLYSLNNLAIDGYLQQRDRTQHQLTNIVDKFREKMQEYTSSDSASTMIFTEDLKNMVHIADKDDMPLIKRMMIKFNGQNKELRFGSFIFGPVVMRMYHYLNCPEDALECFLDPKLTGFFDQVMSCQILLDLLFVNGKYEDMLKVFQTTKDRQLNGQLYQRNAVVLAFAALYKMNTEESLAKGLTLWKEICEFGHTPMRRAATFLAGLCLAQKKPDIALEIASSCNNQNYTTIRNVKVMALCQLNRCEDIMPILSSILHQDTLEQGRKHTFNTDTIQIVDKVMSSHTNGDLKTEYQHLRKQFDQLELVSNTTLDDQLMSPIEMPSFIDRKGAGRDNAQRRNQPQSYSNYSRQQMPRRQYYQHQDNQQQDTQQRQQNRRPGLYDMR